MDDKVEPKYRPKFKHLDKNDKLVPKWAKIENEHSFFYVHNEPYKNKIDLDIC